LAVTALHTNSSIAALGNNGPWLYQTLAIVAKYGYSGAWLWWTLAIVAPGYTGQEPSHCAPPPNSASGCWRRESGLSSQWLLLLSLTTMLLTLR